MMEELPKRRFTGVFIPVEIIDVKELSWMQRLLWAEIHALHDLKRGGCFASNEYLAEVLGVSPGSIANDLTVLRRMGWIRRISKPNSIRVLVVAHPDSTSPNSEVTSPNSETGFTKPGSPLHQTVKCLIEEKKDKVKDLDITHEGEILEFSFQESVSGKPETEPVSRRAEAEAIYKAYPRRVAKVDAIKSILKAFKEITPAELLDAVRKYALSCRGKDAKFIPHPATWFNGGRWADEIPNEQRHNDHYSNASWLHRDNPDDPGV